MAVSGTSLAEIRTAIRTAIEGITPTVLKDRHHTWSFAKAIDFGSASARTFTVAIDHDTSRPGSLFCGGYDSRIVDVIVRVGYANLARFDAEEMIEGDVGDLARLSDTLFNSAAGILPPPDGARRVVPENRVGGIGDEDDAGLRIDYRIPISYMVEV